MKPPRKLQTDMGKEFYNSHVKRVLNRYRVHHFSTDQPLKAQIVEHFNRTLRETIKQSMAYRKSLDYISVLSDFLYGYNARPHSAFLPFAPERSIKITKPRSMNYSTVNISDSRKQNINIPLETM